VHPEQPPAPGADVRAKLDVLAQLADRPLADHAEIYQQLHAELQQALAEIEQGEAAPGTAT
jgi:hypothetical protein